MSKTHHVRRTHRAFTLIELLVVIGIIAILMTLAVPMIHRGLQFANRTRCGSNLKQLGLAVSLYMDHNARNPRNYFPPRLAPNLPPFNNWRDGLTNVMEDASAAKEIFSCPSTTFVTSNSSYSAHPVLFKQSNVPGLNISVVHRPTSVIMFGDAQQVSATTHAPDLFSGFNTNSNPSKSEEMLSSTEIGYRHTYDTKMAAMFVFVDGHTEPIRTNEFRRKNIDLAY